MATDTLNERAVAHARKLIEARQYVLDSDWGEVQPKADDENAYLKSHSWDDYALWHLGLTDGATDETKARHAFVFGLPPAALGVARQPSRLDLDDQESLVRMSDDEVGLTVPEPAVWRRAADPGHVRMEAVIIGQRSAESIEDLTFSPRPLIPRSCVPAHLSCHGASRHSGGLAVMCYRPHMRVHIDVDEALIERIDAAAGTRRRSQFIRDAVVAALDQRSRGELILAARGAIPDRGHVWDDDPGAWVRGQRRGDARRVG
jgi:Arc/MetJ family transcription regulator